MIPASFEYHAPATLDEAVRLLLRHGDDAKILSGGQSLLPLMKLRLAAPAHVVDINRIPGLGFLEQADGVLRVGALVREADLEESDLVRSTLPILTETARQIADPLVRNLATVGGNLAHGDPANDHPATMLALGAEVVATGKQGARRIPIEGFFTGPFSTALRADEVLTEIRIPLPPARSGGAYLKVERKVGDYATAGVAVQVTLTAEGTVAQARIGLTNVGLTPIRAEGAAAWLQGRTPTEAVVAGAARLAAEAAQPGADLRGPADYKRDLVRVLTGRALRRAIGRARGVPEG
jgi:carbon-monoxide dehydrogenase medium subunit